MPKTPAVSTAAHFRVSMVCRVDDLSESPDIARIAGPNTMQCRLEDSLLEIWTRFAEETGTKVRWTQDNQPHSVDFMDAADQSIRGHGFFGVDATEKLVVRQRWQDLTIQEILGADRRGIYSGAIDHIEFLDHPPVGNGFWLDWDGLTTALKSIDTALMIVGAITSAVTAKEWAGAAADAAAEMLLGRGNRALEMVEEYREQWESGDLGPDALGDFLRIDSVRDSDSLQLLGMESEDDLEILRELLNPGEQRRGLAPFGRTLLRFYYVESGEFSARLAIQLLEESLDSPGIDPRSNDLFLRCVCPKKCGCLVEISSLPQGLKFGFTEPTDHFVIRRSRLDDLDDYTEYI